jgi:hypothetical protein
MILTGIASKAKLISLKFINPAMELMSMIIRLPCPMMLFVRRMSHSGEPSGRYLHSAAHERPGRDADMKAQGGSYKRRVYLCGDS